MIRLLYAGDPHLRGTTPRNRTDNYVDTVKAKLREIYSMAIKYQVEALIFPGDLWDRPEVSISVLLDFIKVLDECPVPIFTTVGNHEIYGYNLETYDRSSLKLTEMLLNDFIVVKDSDYPIFLGHEQKPEVALTFTPYSGKMDVNGYGYEADIEVDGDLFNIHVAHGMLLDHMPPFDRYTLLKDVKTDADLVLTGHDHMGYGVYRRADGKIFCNPGSITRLSASTGEVKRPVQVSLITVNNMACTIDLLPLNTARPGEEVLDRSQIEAEDKRQYAMDQFSALIQSKTGNKVLLDINQIVQELAAVEGLAPEIVQKTIEKIDKCREFVL